MSTLTYGNHAYAPALPESGKAPRKSVWRRIFDALMTAQQRRADREIARFLASHGGLMTDEMERQMMLRLTGNGRKLV